MTTIVIDIANGIAYSDSRTSFNGKPHKENTVKLFKKGNRIYFGAGDQNEILKAIHEMDKGVEPYLREDCHVGYLEKAFPDNIVVVYSRKQVFSLFGRWMKKYAQKKQCFFSETSINGKVVFGSGFDHARFAIDVCDESPSAAIRSAAEHDQYTNKIVQKLML